MQNITDLFSSREKVTKVTEQSSSRAHSSLNITPRVVIGASLSALLES